MVLGIRRVHQNKGKRKSKNSKQKKKGGIVPISSDPRSLGVGSEDRYLLVGKQEESVMFPRFERPCNVVQAGP